MHHGRRWAVGVGVLILMGVLTTGLWASAATGALAQTGAGDRDGTAQCSVATLKGTYLFAPQGHQIEGHQHVLLAGAGHEVYDGNGQMRGVATLSVNGELARNNRYTGTYTVNKDCTGTLTLDIGEHFDLFIAPDGSELTFIQTDPGFVLSGVERRATTKRVGG